MRCLILFAALTAACSNSRPAQERLLPVVAGDRLAPTTSDQGWRVTLDTWRVAGRDLAFTIRGEMHAGLLRRLGDFVVGAAHAHPGHLAGGEVTGELAGPFLLDLARGGAVGTARLLEGAYQGANFTFRRAGAGDGLLATDPLFGHTLALAGTAEKGGRTIRFDARLDVAEGTQVTGLPFRLDVGEATRATLVVTGQPTDPLAGGSRFDGFDFAAFDADGDGRLDIQPGTDAHNVLVRAFVTHDAYGVHPEEEP